MSDLIPVRNLFFFFRYYPATVIHSISVAHRYRHRQSLQLFTMRITKNLKLVNNQPTFRSSSRRIDRARL